MTGPLLAKLIYDDLLDRWMVSCPFNKGWLEDFRKNVPAQARKWHADIKTWEYDPFFHDAVKTICEIHFGGYKEHRPTPPPPPPKQESSSSIFKDFLKICTPDSVKKLYRENAKSLHPDLGGDTKKATELNVLWAKVKEELGLS